MVSLFLRFCLQFNLIYSLCVLWLLITSVEKVNSCSIQWFHRVWVPLFGRPVPKTKHSNHKKNDDFLFIVIFPFVRHIINNPKHNQNILSNSHFLLCSLFVNKHSFIRVSYNRHEKLCVCVCVFLRQFSHESFVTFCRLSFHIVGLHYLDGWCVFEQENPLQCANMPRQIRYSIFYWIQCVT